METATERRAELVAHLTGHPTVVDVVRVLAALTRSTVEVVVFEGERAMVVGSLGQRLLQPRPLAGPEQDLVVSGARHASGPDGVSAAIVDADGSTIGAVSVGAGRDIPDIEVLLGLSRVCSSLIEPSATVASDAEILLENLRDAVIVIDPNMVVLYANRAIGIQIGRSPSEIVGRSISDLVHPEDIASAFDALLRLGGGSEVYRLGVRVLHGSGAYIRLEVTGKDMTSDPRVGGTLLSLRNGDHDLELETTLERVRRLSNALVEQLHDGIIATDAVGSVLVVNDAAHQILGLPRGTAPAEIAVDALEFLDASARPIERERHPIRRALRGERISNEAMSVVADGQVRDLVVSGRPVVDTSGTPIGAAIGFHDVSEARSAQRELRTAALHDQLTGLPNRRQLKERVEEFLRDAEAGDRRPVAECLIDLDNFKVINDTHGHRIGDQVIRTAAERLSVGRGDNDLLVRLGGDEFVVLSRGQTLDEARAEAEKMRRLLAMPFDVDSHMFSLTCSIGVAHLEIEDLQADTLLRYADLALYAAKERGRNRVEVFDNELAAAAQEEAHQREFLRQVLDEDGLVMHFQPLVDSSTGHIVGFESLARCRTRDGSLVGPGQFLAAASGSGLIWDLDRQAFNLTCQAAALLTSHASGLTMACNFSALSIVQPDFVDHVRTTMRSHGVSPSTICIEITESAAFEAGASTLAALRTLHELGVKLALDDFGTGYSSLSHLRDLPLATVKVDRSFIAKLDTSTSERSIAEAVVNLARGLGLGIVAEGVETPGQLAAAQAIGFNVIQGWHYSPARDLAEILAEVGPQSGGGHPVPANWSLTI